MRLYVSRSGRINVAEWTMEPEVVCDSCSGTGVDRDNGKRYYSGCRPCNGTGWRLH